MANSQEDLEGPVDRQGNYLHAQIRTATGIDDLEFLVPDNDTTVSGGGVVSSQRQGFQLVLISVAKGASAPSSVLDETNCFPAFFEVLECQHDKLTLYTLNVPPPLWLSLPRR